MKKTDCLIIGSGPAGYTAAIYASRANLKPIMIEGLQPGGQLTTTTDVENFPGYPNGIMGPEMMEDLKNQAARFGTEIISGFVTSVDFSKNKGGFHKITVDEEKIFESKTVIISTGASAKYLGLDSEKNSWDLESLPARYVMDSFIKVKMLLWLAVVILQLKSQYILVNCVIKYIYSSEKTRCVHQK